MAVLRCQRCRRPITMATAVTIGHKVYGPACAAKITNLIPLRKRRRAGVRRRKKDARQLPLYEGQGVPPSSTPTE